MTGIWNTIVFFPNKWNPYFDKLNMCKCVSLDIIYRMYNTWLCGM